MKYTKYNVTDKSELDNLYKHSALTIEGLAEESIPDFVDWLKNNTEFTVDNPIIYIVKGKTMNETYNLTGNNKYQDDLTLVSVIDINQKEIVFKRFEIGGRWFDDIVENNASREMS